MLDKVVAMAMNPSPLSLIFLSLCTLFSATLVSSSTSISYSQHCASTVPESTPTTQSNTAYPYHHPSLVTYTGGNRIHNNPSSKFSFESEKYYWFISRENIFETNTSGVYAINACLTIQLSGYYSRGNLMRRNSLDFTMDGFWSQYSGKLCMVGSASRYLKGGNNLINLDAVLKLNYPMNLTIFSGLITGKLESLASANDPNYFEPILLWEFASSSSNYQYSLVSGEFDSDCCGGINIPKNQSLDLNPELLCSTFNGFFKLEYSNDCSSSKNCTPLDKDYLPTEMKLKAIQCSERENKVQYLIQFFGSDNYQPHDPSTTLVGEGSWDEKKNRLYIVACRFLNSVDSLDNARVGDCSTRLSLRLPSFWTIKNRTSIFGQIWTNKTANESGYFNRIAFKSRDITMPEVPGLRYEYTLTEKVRKLCPFNKPVLKKGNIYPNPKLKYSNDLAFEMLVTDSTGNHSWFYAVPNVFDDQNYVVNKFAISTSMTEIEEKSTCRGPIDISYTILPNDSPSDTSVISENTLYISAEGLYDEETGRLCMVGCRKSSSGESMDCEILLKFQFPPVNAKEEGQITGSMESLREETEPLYFKQLETTSTPFYGEEAKRSLWPLDLEIVLVIITNTLSCVFIGLQLLYVKRNPQLRPFVSVVMLLLLTLGHMIPLLLNFASLFLGNRNKKNVLLKSEVNEMVMTVTMMAALLLQFRLLQQVFFARLADEKGKGLWQAEMRALLLSPPLYMLRLLFVLSHSKGMVYSSSVLYDTQYLWRDLKCYGRLVLDFFLIPQILLNIFQISTMNALSPPFYIGTTCVRLLPRAYDLYRIYRSWHARFDGGYIFANLDADFYSPSWDVLVSCWCVLFAVVIYLQQRFG